MSFAMLAGTAQNEIPGPRTRILVVKSVNGSANTPYLGLLINGVPSMAKINSDSMTESDRKSDLSCVFREVTLNDSRVMIPDMAELDKTIQSVISEDGEEET